MNRPTMHAPCPPEFLPAFPNFDKPRNQGEGWMQNIPCDPFRTRDFIISWKNDQASLTEKDDSASAVSPAVPRYKSFSEQQAGGSGVGEVFASEVVSVEVPEGFAPVQIWFRTSVAPVSFCQAANFKIRANGKDLPNSPDWNGVFDLPIPIPIIGKADSVGSVSIVASVAAAYWTSGPAGATPYRGHLVARGFLMVWSVNIANINGGC